MIINLGTNCVCVFFPKYNDLACINQVLQRVDFHIAMAAATQHNKLDARVRSFLERRGYGAKQHVFAGMDYDTFMKLPDNLLRHLGLPDSFVEDRAIAKADRIFAKKKSDLLECDDSDSDDRDEPEEYYCKYLRVPPPRYVTEDRVTSHTVPRLGDGCCGGVNAIKARPESPDAYQTQCYYN